MFILLKCYSVTLLNEMKKKLLILLKKEAFFNKKVKLSSGKISNFYIDVRRVSLTPQGLYLISSLIWKIIKNEKITAVGGPTLGADPIVSALCLFSYRNKKPLKGFLIRKTPKKHGQRRLIEGCFLKEKDKVIIIDDVATTGESLIRTIEVLKKDKVKAEKAIVVIDREEGAKENLLKLRCPLISLFKKSDFFK